MCSNPCCCISWVESMIVLFFPRPGFNNRIYWSGGVKAIKRTARSTSSPTTAIDILFLHSFTGCDTTSASFRKSKLGFLKLYLKSEMIKKSAVTFYNPSSTKYEVEEARKMCFLKWYGTPARLTSLNKYRYQSFMRSVANIKPNFSSLPPTESAAKQHSLRTYHQVQQWLGNELPPQEWGVEKCRKHPGANHNRRFASSRGASDNNILSLHQGLWQWQMWV